MLTADGLGGRGWVVFTGPDGIDESEARSLTLGVSRSFGRPLPQDSAGRTLREVRDRGVRLEERATARYSDTRQGGGPHTDGCHRPGTVPDLVVMYCVRPARHGGELVLVHIDDVLAALRPHPDVLRTLRQPVLIDTRERVDGRPAAVRRPVLEPCAGGERIHYLRSYIESAHRHDGAPPLTTQQVAAFDLLDEVLARNDIQVRLRLRAGQLIVVDNRAVLHSRTTFTDDPRCPRLVLRTWVATCS